MEHLLRDVKDATVSTLSTEVERMSGGLKTLKSRLIEIQQYLELVLKGKLPVNHDIIYSLQARPQTAHSVLDYAAHPRSTIFNHPLCPSSVTRRYGTA